MKDRYKLAAAVLIGGRSTRMGRPKENMVIEGDGRTFLNRICDEVDKAYPDIIKGRYLSARVDQDSIREGYTKVTDLYEMTGPISGIVSVLKKAENDGYDAVLILACDLIKYDIKEITAICERYRGEDILLARTDGCSIQPLASIYSVSVIPAAVSNIRKKDLKIRNMISESINTGYYETERSFAYENRNSP